MTQTKSGFTSLKDLKLRLLSYAAHILILETDQPQVQFDSDDERSGY